MNDYAIVLNAGSSSLKFCVYARPQAGPWRLGGARPDRGHRDLAAILSQGRLRRGASPTSSSTRTTCAMAAPRSIPWPPGCAPSTAVRASSASVIASSTAARALPVPTIVTPQVLEELRTLIPLAPLHQPHNLAAIDAVSEQLPGVPQVACFDTSFHRGQPAVAEVVPLPRDICAGGVQRYGFHGLSYEYIASVLPEVAPEIANGRVIVAHLGAAPACAR